MIDRPILFSTPMVRALLAGSKTQTRRVLKPQPPADSGPLTWTAYQPTKVDRYGEEYPGPLTLGASSEDGSFAAPIKIAPGDRLWVRESWDFLPLDEPKPEGSGRAEIVYWADAERLEFDVPAGFDPMIYGCERFRPSIHMPRWASRLTLTVIDIRVQRLQDIKGRDITAEGVRCEGCFDTGKSACQDGGCFGQRIEFQSLWNRINGAGAWDANPWVVAYSFAVERRNIDEAA